MKQKILLTFALLLTAVTGAWADDPSSCGDGVTWSYVESTHTLTISYIGSGTGEMADYSGEKYNDCPWASYKAQITTVIIGSGVTTIGESAFEFCTNLTSVNIPATVTSIGNRAFEFCSNLASVNIPASVTTIGDYAFNDCNSLTAFNVDAENNNYSSADGVLFNKDKTTLVLYPLGKTATSYTIPASVTSIEERAFLDCTNLATVTFEGASELTTIGMNAFGNCSNLASINIPAKVTSIGVNVFYGCSKLAAINVADGNNNYSSADGVLFNKDKTTLVAYPAGKTATSYTIPASVTSIGEDAFFGCTNLTTVTFDNQSQLTTIGNYAFYDCTNLASVTLPASVTSIGIQAFSGCTSLASINIPASVTSIGEDAFSGCTSLASISFAANTPLTSSSIANSAFFGCTNLKTLTISGTGAMADYNSINQPWNSFKNQITSVIIESGVTSIGGYAFLGCSNLASITIPDGVTSISQEAFYECAKLESVTIPNSVTTIGDYAFGGCTNLAAFNVADGNANYSSEDGVLFNKDKTTIILYPLGKTATSYTLPATVTSIGENAFYNCTKLESVTIPAGVTSIGEDAFYNCGNLASVTFDGTPALKTIGDRAFYQCIKLEAFPIPASVTSIGEGGFELCTKLAAFNVADGSNNYSSEDGVLFNKDKTTLILYPLGKTATSYTIPAGVTSIGENAFYLCQNLQSVSIPASVTTIGTHAFSRCSSLTSVTLPASVTSIGEGAFSGCTSLASVTVYATTPPSLGQAAFVQNASGRKIYVPSISVDTYKGADNWSTYADDIEAIPAAASGTCGTTGHESDVTWEIIGTSPNYTLIISGTGAMADYSGENFNTRPWKNDKESITSVVIGSGVTGIGNYAFYDCTKLASITIPASVTSIGEGAFYNCQNLATVAFAANSALTTIGNSAFDGCSTLTAINIPAGVTSIGDWAFFNCDKLTSVTFAGTSVKTIGDNAFYLCTNLASITIPASVTSIGMGAFFQCGNLGTITMNSSPLIGDDAFEYIKEGAAVTINAPAHDANDYQWATFYNENYAFQADENTQVFKVALDGTTVELLEVTDKIVNKNTAVVLKSTGTPVMTLTSETSSDMQANDLVGTSTTIPNPGNAYVLNNGDEGVGFYKLAGTGTIGFGKAYLVASAAARDFLGFDETTSLTPIPSPIGEGGDVIYDIHGRRVNGKPGKGLYIINGKKVVL